MRIKRTKEHMVLKLTHKEFDTFFAALDSINEGTDAGAYLDVVKMYQNVLSIHARLEAYKDNVWLAPMARKK